MGDRHKVASFNNKMIVRCIKTALRALRDDLIAPLVYAKAGYCLSLMAHLHKKGSNLIVANGGISAILSLKKAFPLREKLQISVLGTLTVITMHLEGSSMHGHASAIESAVTSVECLPTSCRVYEAACLLISVIFPKVKLNILEYEKVLGSVLLGLAVHGDDEMAHFAGCRAIECLFSESSFVMTRRIAHETNLSYGSITKTGFFCCPSKKT